MCGVAAAVATPDARRTVALMCDAMVARGPDDAGVVERPGHVALGNRRLAIIDPTADGHQPMLDDERGNAIVYNGMLYNYRELRDELERAGESFTSGCDTEVLLKAYGRWGDTFVGRLEGMFAFVIHDAARNRVVLGRDRLGIKPLYYTMRDGALYAASQVKALLVSGGAEARLDAAGIASFLAYGAVTEPTTIIEGVHALPAGHIATFDGSGFAITRYWGPLVRSGAHISRREAASVLRGLLEDAVVRHLVADAPTGVFLSGGIDSSVIAALAAHQQSGVTTLTVGFDGPTSEHAAARAFAERIGSCHIDVCLEPEDLQGMLSGAFEAMDQPTFDGINTFVVSRAAARSGIKVALSGLGADELFDGYGFQGRAQMLSIARRLPAPLRRAAANRLPPSISGNRDKLVAWLRGEAGESPRDLMRRLYLDADVGSLMASECHGSAHSGTTAWSNDLTGYMKNVLLRDSDAMSMASSIELRVPYLDDRIVEWTGSLPAKIVGQRKRLLLDATSDLLPDAAQTAPKQGFVLPLAGWMRSELRADVEATLAQLPAALRPYLDQAAVEAQWRRYQRTGEHWLRAWALYALARWTASLDAVTRPRLEAVA